jgi:thiamine-phosphate pyrophosphorylase
MQGRRRPEVIAAEAKSRCRLYLQFPACPSATLEAELGPALTGTDVACVLLRRDDATAGEDRIASIVELVQRHGVACLIDQDIELAARLHADGVHVDADAHAYAEARSLLGKDASIGAHCGLSRHDAMRLAEAGADYVAFGQVAGSLGDALDQCEALVWWWSEIFVVPCVVFDIDDADAARKLATAGADFIAPSAGIWETGNALARLSDLGAAIGEARRAA